MNAYCIGNGESRKYLNLDSLTAGYETVGCNALHREFTPDHLVCCDRRMVEEAVANLLMTNTKIYPRDSWYKYFRKVKKDKRINLLPPLPYQERNTKADYPEHWGSGTYAVLLASTLPGIEEVNLIGFDLYSVNDKVNNLYKGTNNYAKKDAKPIDYSFWIYQTRKVFVNFPNIKYNIFNDKNWKLPKDWNLPNTEYFEYS